MFQYLKDFPEQGIIINYHNLVNAPVLPVPDASFEQQYLDAFEEIYPNIAQAFGPPLQASIFFDSDLGA